MSRHRSARTQTALAALVLLGLAGCGGAPKTYPVQGKVVLANGNAAQLAGGNVEFMLESDPTVRAYGDVQEDGTFSVKTLYQGRELDGAPEGTYKARIILNGDDAQPRDRLAMDPRFLDFQTSGLSFQVPSSGDITVQLLPPGAAGKAAPPRRSAE